ncbi:MAG: response regulator with CheY-like receiver AAA-type ATPase and DNA-binding domain [Rhodocyclaceae bacterium]|nr:MAG: response regulator with CheY-like receiver AAA-type ATPase and DNA-binding domain [Rhodocyclaceae bacterium]
MNLVGKKVLVVDDMSAIRQVIMAHLKSVGCEPLGVSNGRVALDLLARRPFDLVLSDWNMPGMDGTQLVTAIRARNKTIPIVMVTAEGDPKLLETLRELGISGYIIKPFKPQALLKLLQKIFPKR